MARTKTTPNRKPPALPPMGGYASNRLSPTLRSVMVRKGHQVKPSTLASGSHSIICPSCEADELRSGCHNGVRCSMCGYAPSRSFLETLRQIIALPDALGSHACEECGHPEMRRLPDRVLRCPACGSEGLPTNFQCLPQTVGPSSGHRQGGGGNPDAPSAPKKPEARDASAGRRHPMKDLSRELQEPAGMSQTYEIEEV
jgi:ribosomal protein L37AE/L43A